MSNNDNNAQHKQNNARRKLLKTVVAGGGTVVTAKLLPEQWMRPVVENTLLPAHAQTSPTPPAPTPPASPLGNFTTGGAVQVGMLVDPADSQLAGHELSDELLEFFLPAAAAGPAYNCPPNTSCDVEIRATVSNVSAWICFTTTSATSGCQVDANLGVSPPILTGSCPSFPFAVLSASFQAPNWVMSVANDYTNVVTQVILSPGGVGCVD